MKFGQGRFELGQFRDDVMASIRSNGRPCDEQARLDRKVLRKQIRELQSENEKLRRLCSEDPLTELFNRRGFFRMLEAEFASARRAGDEIACVYIDLDRFKLINDVYGHEAGDIVLQRFSALLQSACRKSDIVGRVGGEEFCVVLPRCDERRAVQWAEKLRQRLQRTSVVIGGRGLVVSASFGVAAGQADLREEYELLRQADQALLAAKNAGRDRVIAASGLSDGQHAGVAISESHGLVRMLLHTLSIRDPATADHSRRAAHYSSLLAKQSGMHDNEVWVVSTAALLHDIGKLGLPDSILRKPGKLDDVERNIVARCLESGHDTVRAAFGIGPLSEALQSARTWRRDVAQIGSARAPMAGRIVAIADAFDAMVAPSVYRKPLSRRAAVLELERCASDPLDERLIRELNRCVDGGAVQPASLSRMME